MLVYVIMWLACNFDPMLPNRTNRSVPVSEFSLSLSSAGLSARVHGENGREGEDVSVRRRRGNGGGRE